MAQPLAPWRPSRHFTDPRLSGLRALVVNPASETLQSRSSKGPALTSAAADYIDLAQRSSLPPSLWLFPRHDQWQDTHLPPLVYFHSLGSETAARAQAAQAFADAGCSLWDHGADDWGVNHGRFQSYLSSKDLAEFILAGSNTPLRRLYLKLALNDPKSPADFPDELTGAYARAVAQSSKTSKQSLGPGDERAQSVCSILEACSAELAAAASRSGPWRGLPSLLADAQERLAAKATAPDPLSPEALKASVTPEQRLRLRSLAAVLSKCPEDEAFIIAGLDGSPWLKAQPALACLPIATPHSLLAQALASGCLGAIEWLDKAGANLWLASAQAGEANACLWAARRLRCFPKDADFSPLARALLRGAWLDGSPDPQARCLALAKAAVDIFCSDTPSSGDSGRAEANQARAFLATLEKIAISESIAPREPPSASKIARRPAL